MEHSAWISASSNFNVRGIREMGHSRFLGHSRETGIRMDRKTQDIRKQWNIRQFEKNLLSEKMGKRKIQGHRGDPKKT